MMNSKIIELLKEMKDNCYKGNLYDDPKRDDKAEALNFAIFAAESIEGPRIGSWNEVKEHIYLATEAKEWTNFYCSECDAPNSDPTPYCPYCGTKMDLDAFTLEM